MLQIAVEGSTGIAGAVVDAVRVDVAKLGVSALQSVVALPPWEEEAVARAGLVERGVSGVGNQPVVPPELKRPHAVMEII